MTSDAIRAAFPAYPANESAVAIAYGELLGGTRDAIRATCAAHSQATLSFGQRLMARWRAWRREREERTRLEALAPLAPHLLRDIGVSEEHRSIVLARQASHYERSFSSPDAASTAARFGGW